MYRRYILIGLAVIFFFVWIIGSFRFIFMSKSEREFYRKHPWFDLRLDIKNASDLQMRIMGVCLFIFGGLFEFGLILIIIGW